MKTFRSIGLIAISGIAFGCSSETETEAPTVDTLGPGEVAVVDGERIAESVFRVFTLNALQANADDLTEEGRAEVIDRLVLLQVLANEAERAGLQDERRTAAELELQRINLLARAMTERFREENPPTESELRDLYEENLPRLRTPEYKTRHILVESEDEAIDLIEQLDNGADFAELARENSTGPSAPDGGDLGWASADSYVAPFAEAVRASTPGEYYPAPVETEFGWHVIFVEDYEEQAAPGLETVRQELTIAVQNQKLDEYVNSLRSAATVSVVE